MGRGNGGATIFTDDEDRMKFLSLLGEGVERFGHSVYAFCLMGNHFHLVVRTGETPLSTIMQNLMFRYTIHFNRRTRRYGHLFQGRFKSVLVDEQRYLLELVRYVHLNPVRSGLVELPQDWIWSGHPAYLGKSKEHYLDTEWVLGIFGGKPAVARRRYEEFVLQGIGEESREDFHKGGPNSGVLGDEDFLKRIHVLEALATKPAVKLAEVVTAICRAREISTAVLTEAGRGHRGSEGRALVGLVSQELKAATLTEVAEYTGRDLTTISRVVWNLRKRLKDEPGEARNVSNIIKKLIREGKNNATTQA